MNLRETARGGGVLSRFAHLAGLSALAGQASDAPGPEATPPVADPRQDPAPQPQPNPQPNTPAQPGEGGAEPVPGAQPNPAPAQPAAPPAGDASAYARGFADAQARAAAILQHPAAAGQIALAAELACGNALPADQAVALLLAGSVVRQASQPAPQPQRASLDDRMRGQATRGVGPDAGGAAQPDPNDPQAVAASILAARDKVRGVTANAKG